VDSTSLIYRFWHSVHVYSFITHVCISYLRFITSNSLRSCPHPAVDPLSRAIGCNLQRTPPIFAIFKCFVRRLLLELFQQELLEYSHVFVVDFTSDTCLLVFANNLPPSSQHRFYVSRGVAHLLNHQITFSRV